MKKSICILTTNLYIYINILGINIAEFKRLLLFTHCYIYFIHFLRVSLWSFFINAKL